MAGEEKTHHTVHQFLALHFVDDTLEGHTHGNAAMTALIGHTHTAPIGIEHGAEGWGDGTEHIGGEGSIMAVVELMVEGGGGAHTCETVVGNAVFAIIAAMEHLGHKRTVSSGEHIAADISTRCQKGTALGKIVAQLLLQHLTEGLGGCDAVAIGTLKTEDEVDDSRTTQWM